MCPAPRSHHDRSPQPAGSPTGSSAEKHFRVCRTRRQHPPRWLGVSIALLLILISVAGRAPSSAAQPIANPLPQIEAHLRAGEFAPALGLARSIANPASRDAALASIARVQARSGARRGALDTAGSMADDRLRTGALDAIAAQPPGAAGGGTQADFDTLIELITSTIAPQTWDAVGGPGAIDGFPGGVYVDTSGLMRRLPERAGTAALSQLYQASRWPAENQDPRVPSPLRKVSLTRLEKQLQMRWALGQEPTDAMRHLAGLQKVSYLFFYPQTGEVVLAGPAGDWISDPEGRSVSADTGRPVLQLDDFVVVLRNAQQAGGRFTCSITPRQENLAAAQRYLNETSQTPLKAGQTNSWLNQLRSHLGWQAVEVQGIDPRTRVARVIVEADYRMKLVGMGLEDGVLGVTSYLDSLPAGEEPPGMSVLRWWFTMNYAALRATPDRRAYELRGQGVQVLSENEMLSARGERIHTGQSDERTAEFAHSFTRHFDALAAKYPIYAELQNVFDLALVAALMLAEDLPGQADWHLVHWSDPQRYQVALGPAPTEVETVVNHRQLQRNRIVAGVSGGVSVDSSRFVSRPAIQTDDYGGLQAEHAGSRPQQLDAQAWWWD